MTDVILKAVETGAEYEASRRLSLSVFREHFTEEEVVANIEESKHEPGFNFANHHIAVVDGDIVAHAKTNDYRLRYGEVELRMGGIGGVCTHPDHRMKGYAAAVMNRALEYMQSRGDHVALLITGQVNFYTRMGYHTVWSPSRMVIQAADAAGLAAPLKVRPATPKDLSQMAALYDRHWNHRITRPRSAETWRWYILNRPERLVRVVESGAGDLLGYAIGVGGNELEVVVDSQEALGSLLAHLAQDWPTLEILMHADEALLHYTRRLVNGVLTTAYTFRSDWMARLVNAAAFRDAILPEMTRQSGIDTRGLIFDIQSEQVYLGLRGQDATNVTLSMADFLELVFGVVPPAVLPLHTDAVQLLERLFPRRPLMIAPLDWF